MPNDMTANIGEWIQSAKTLSKLLAQVDKIAGSEASDYIKSKLIFGLFAPEIRELCGKLDMKLEWEDNLTLYPSERVANFRHGVLEVVVQTKPILEAFGQGGTNDNH